MYVLIQLLLSGCGLTTINMLSVMPASRRLLTDVGTTPWLFSQEKRLINLLVLVKYSVKGTLLK